ncbi:glycosyltransferase [Paracoccus albus]|uniref:glycosyltransferase n=1 Tax=Paracoccus albus TaxID=3017784 RepID=UPI0022F09AD9|nr:glycosyltransferase [Paracoccus albus]WBU62401.1 glycosyltransferase [Paracoccus albus]
MSTASQATIAALVVTHNRLEKLCVTVSRLLAESLDYVLVFDNHSSDGTAAWLETQSNPRLIVIRSPENLGGAGGFSRGMCHLVERFDPDWIVIMDDDGRPCPGCIEAFRKLPGDEWDAIAAAALTPSGTVCEMNRPYRNPFWHLPEFLRTFLGGGRRGFHLPDLAYDPQAAPVAVDMASFVGLFLSRKAIAIAGYPDERLFIYGDDQIYTLTLRRRGGSIGFLPQIRFEHDTTSIQANGQLVLNPLWKVYYNYRNAIFAYRVAAGRWFWPLFPVLALKWNRNARHYGDDSAEFRRILGQAIRDGLSRRLDRTHDEITALTTGRQTAGEIPRKSAGVGK